MAQKDTNPYRYSDSNKRYMTYDWYMKARFGGKIAKVPLDAGLTCPNKDGTCGTGGCVFCLAGSTSARGGLMSLTDQYEQGVRTASRKWVPSGFIPYLQANTNTYGEIQELRKIWNEAASMPGAMMLDIATRADCLNGEVLDELAELSTKIPLTVELGLQSSNDLTAERINRGHTFHEFVDGWAGLKKTADAVNSGCSSNKPNGFLFRRFTICIHIINGLPGESRETMMQTALDVAELMPDMVKIHLLHVLKGTELEKMYLSGDYAPLTPEEYVDTTCGQLEVLPPETCIARITGDAPDELLVAPLWCRRKTQVTNNIDKELFKRNTYQGRLFTLHTPLFQKEY